MSLRKKDDWDKELEEAANQDKPKYITVPDYNYGLSYTFSLKMIHVENVDSRFYSLIVSPSS